ncbi:MAG: InlB B-repeat-containing protein [Paludibacteraceae bacterium]
MAHPQDISWDEPINTTIQVGEKGRSVSATAPSGLKVTYSSDNTSVLTVDADGNLTANAIGTAIITATVASDCYYASKFITKEFTVLSKKTPSFWLENDPDLTEKALLVDETTTVTVQNIDDSNSAFSITSSNNNIVSCSSVVDGIATITAKNAGTATLTFNQTNTDNVFPASSTFTFTISKHQGTLSINSNLGNRYKVDDEIGDYTSFYTASNSEVTVNVQSSNSNVIAIENNKLKAVGAGKATITFSQDETYKWVSTTASKEITVEKYTLSASINQSTATWGETISNPFTVTDDRENNFSGYSVTAVNPSIADYVNGQIVTYSTDGKAQFTISYGETYKYKALNQTVDLSVAAAADECYVVSQLDEITINNNTFNFNGGIGETLTCHLSGSTGWTPAVGTITITGNKAGGSSTTLLKSDSKDFRDGIDITIPLNSDITSITISYSGSYNAYVTNLKVTRSNYLNANATSVEAVGAPDGNPSRSFSVNYSDCGSTFNVRSSNPKITVSPATFNVSAGNGTQTITFTGNTQATGKETATITVYNQSRKVEVPVTCYQQYTVTFNPGEGATVGTTQKDVTYEHAYGELPTPTKTGYTFAGWYTAATGGSQVTSETVCKTADAHTVYAHWTANTYQVTFNPGDGASVSPAQQSVIFDNAYGTLPTPTKTGYTFAGWYTAATGGSQVTSETVCKTADAHTVYAHWTANTYDLTLNYNFDGALNNGVFYSQANYFTYDAAYEITETPNANPTGYHFVGWFANADGTGDQWTSGTYKTADHTVLYAKWTINTYDLTFVLNDGSWVGTAPADNKITLTYGQTYGDQLASEKIERSGYTFQGWFSDANFATDSKVEATDVVLTPPTTLYAKWLINALTATFDANYPNGRQGATYSFSSSVHIGETYTLPETNPSIDGYKFAGWRTETNIMVDASTLCQIGKNHTLYGCWTANSYEVSYDPNQGNWSGNGQPTKVNLTYDQTYGQDSKFPAAPTRDGYTFQGWWTAADGGQQVTDETIMETAAAHTLYAHWSSNQYKLIFDYKDEAGTTVPVGVTFDANYPAVSAYPTQPVRTGFSFVGWYNAANEPIDLYELPNKKYTTVGNERLFAHWNPLHFTVQFKTSAESEPIDTMSISVAYHDVYGILPNLKENGAEVTTSWYDAPANGMLVTSATIFQPEDINQDFVLYAATSPRKFALQLVDGNETTTIGITKGQTYAAALAAAGIDKTETGKTFLGWSDTQNGNLKNLEDGFDETCQTLYARWKTQTIEVRFVDAEHSAANYGVMSVPYGETYGNGVRLNAAQTGLPSVAEVTGKTFKGWAYADNMFVNNTTPATFTTADHTLTAVWMANNYTIYLHENTGVDKTSAINVTYGETYTLTAPAERTGYTFAGWFTKQEGGDLYDLTSRTYETVGDLHLYAHWTAVSDITVSFNADGGSAVASSIYATYGQDYGDLPTTTKDGYTFVGWFTAAEGGTEVTNTTICKQTADHNLYAHWTANNYTIYLHENTGVDKTSTLAVTYGQTYTLTAPAERTGYTFAGWFTKQEGGDRYDLTTRTYKIARDLDLYAHWTAISGITVSFDADGGEAVACSISATYGQAYGELPTTMKDGYTFVGWFNADGNIVSSEDICRNATSHTLTAHWTANAYTLTFDANGGECAVANKKVIYNTAIGQLPTPTREGYNFNGWFAASTNEETTAEQSFVGTADLTLLAHWTAVSGITVSFDADGGEAVTNSFSATYGQAYGNLPTTTKAGYTFVGWFNADGNIVSSEDICRNATSHTLTAHWTAKAYTITFDANGGECHTTNKQVVYNTAIGKLPTATREGYKFNGWWASDASEATTEKDIFVGFKNLTLTAGWEACQYTVSFISEGGTTTPADKQVTYQAEYGDLPVVSRDGYTFDGWFTCDNESITSDTKYTKIGDQELHAHWTAQKYTVTFCVAPEVTLDTQKEVTFDSPYGELPTPTLAGYEFTGWYSADLGGSLITSTSTVSTASNHNLYARWTEADITIHFNSNGGSEVADQTRKYEGLYCEPALPTPTKEGYTLIGWYFEDGTLVTSTTKVDRTEAHTLTAYWAQAGVPYLVLGDNWKISSPEADNDYRFKTADGKNYSLSNIRVKAESSFQDGETTMYQASVTIFLNGVFYGVGVEQGQTKVLQTTENGNSCLFTTNNTTWATFQSAEMNKRWFNFDLYEESSGTWRLSISCGKQGNPTEVDNNESEQQARAKKYVEDGKVFIQTKEDRIYNASGQLVK